MGGMRILLALLLLPGAPRLDSFDAAVESFMKERGVEAGALAVVKDGRLVHAKGYGADIEPTSLFRIASVSKPVTAVAVLSLVQKGKLELDAKAFGLLGLAPTDPRAAEITVRQLLQHTAGWDREKSGDPMFKSLEIAKAQGVPPPADANTILRWMLEKPLDFDPGTRHAYSNFGYCVLGRIIEKVSGAGYEVFVKKTVLEPMGITRMRLGKSRLEERAKDEVVYRQPGASPYGGFYLEAMDAHGGWLASAVDLARFASSLDKVLDRKTQETMWAPPPGLKAAAAYYACGWMVRPVGKEGKANTWHNGSLPGTNTLLVRRHDGLTWVALFNQRSPKDGELDPALHRAADAVAEWPKEDLFGRYP